jgi:sec-independent protein translocase protein TatB
MFDFGFSEIMVIGVVLLVVVGPERLPKVARTVGHVLGRVQRYVSDVKSDIQREMQLEELKKLQEQVKQQAQELESSVRGGMASVESEVSRTTEELRSMLPDGGQPSAAPAPTEAGEQQSGAASGAQLLAGGRAGPELPQLELGLDVKSGDKQEVTADRSKA